ncbi:hypothetical protein [Clostridium cellulovorans]|uniref:Uncharacterized protein n=1 Tax=Clostridium cellulovorans (strain ATCC 35296 / DSM 3052 / OCM 3 / 743B) TaxID=573061 RepID=D9SW01_CLOC7|nr:hypothetical protein Clocel_3536 [Clostridium cellulovorans 743B]
MAIRKRKTQANYLKVNNDFEFLGVGFTELNESPGAQVTSKRYIHEASATQSITGYEWTSSFNADQINSEVAIAYIRGIGEMLKLGTDTETEYVIVDLDRPGTAANTFRARKFNIAVQVDSIDDNDGELGMSGSFLGKGDPVEGTFDTTTKTFTAGFTDKTIEVPYTNTGTVSAISIAGVTFNDTDDKFVGLPSDTVSFTFKDGTTTKTATLGSSWTIS